MTDDPRLEGVVTDGELEKLGAVFVAGIVLAIVKRTRALGLVVLGSGLGYTWKTARQVNRGR